MVKIEIQMTRKALAGYLYRHAYKNFSGILSLIICIGILFLGIRNIVIGGEGKTSVLYIVVGLFLLCHTHITIFVSTKKQMKGTFARPLIYTIEKERLLVESGEDQVEYSWEDLQRVTREGSNIIVHSGYRNAFIWPIDAIGDQYGAVIAALKEVMGAEKVKIKQR